MLIRELVQIHEQTPNGAGESVVRERSYSQRRQRRLRRGRVARRGALARRLLRGVRGARAAPAAPAPGPLPRAARTQPHQVTK